jgi:NAD(P)-dependent dehydrogenase (short-subunit alcohol dehydrogenase family)
MHWWLVLKTGSGEIDGLANVAAVFPRYPFLETPRNAWQQVDDVCHRATFFLSQAVANSMVKTKTAGAIVNVASGAGFRPVLSMSAYGGTKGAVIALSRRMAHELAAHKIRVNVMAPGHTASESTLRMVDETGLEEMAKTLAGGRWMEPEEPAEVIVFLLSDASRGMTGAVINVNLGNYMPH